MNPKTEAEAEGLLKFLTKEKFKGVVCPPFIYLDMAVKHKLAVGAQDVFWRDKGAFTGEVSPPMLKDVGASYVIIGHSERRALGDTDHIVNEKLQAALFEGLTAILCVGESWYIRKKGIVAAKRFVAGQLKKDLEKAKFTSRDLIVAYEPIWAIGTGKAETPEGAADMIKFIKRAVKKKVRVLYGGSVSGENAQRLLKERDIDGALVGGASLRPEEFKRIMKL